MVGYLMLKKLRDSTQNGSRQTIKIISPDSHKKILEKIRFKTENTDEPRVCRVCLKDGHIPIYGSSDAPDISEDIRTFADIDISRNDSFPKYLCQSCNSLLQSAKLFRKSAQTSDKSFRKPVEGNQSDKEKNIEKDNVYDSDSQTKEKDVPETDNFHCRRCTLSFETFQEYNEHRLSTEHKKLRRVCPICNNSYVIQYYKTHLALHKMEPSHICDICGKKFIIQGQLTRHRLIHFNNLPFKCSLCPYRGRFTESLKRHMRTHTGEKPYQCTECPSRYVTHSNLSRHMLTHKGDRAFKCESCDRAFFTKRSLNLHLKVDHNGIKDHICNICGKAFGYRHAMMKHQLKIHKREKLNPGRVPLYLQIESQKDQEKS